MNSNSIEKLRGVKLTLHDLGISSKEIAKELKAARKQSDEIMKDTIPDMAKFRNVVFTI